MAPVTWRLWLDKSYVERYRGGFNFISKEDSENRKIFLKRKDAKLLCETIEQYQSKGNCVRKEGKLEAFECWSHKTIAISPRRDNQLFRLFLYCSVNKDYSIVLRECDIDNRNSKLILHLDKGVEFTPEDKVSQIFKLTMCPIEVVHPQPRNPEDCNLM